MLKTRIIPTLLWKDIGLVKGVGFNSWRRVGTIMPSIKVYNMRQVDELIILDITATKEKKEPDYNLIKEISEECFVPLTVGGGINHIEHISKLLQVGADKISINTAAYENPKLISEAANKFGSQCIVISIDAKKNKKGFFECFSHSGKNPTKKEVGAWAKEVEKLGAGEILITSIENDGTMKGYDIDLIKCITKVVNIPVIASGGAGNYKDMYEAIKKTKCSAVAAASIFHFTELTPLGAKQFLGKKGIPVRKSLN